MSRPADGGQGTQSTGTLTGGVPTTRLSRLVLTGFRNYASLRLDCDAPMIALSGPNGAGKTNLLEAISLLAPGRGLRGAVQADLQLRDAPPWAVAAIVQTGSAALPVGTGADPGGGLRRRVRVDGADSGQAALAEVLALVWLTPAMDRLFVEGPAARRGFLDRLIFGHDPAHVGRVARYERAMRERARLLREGGADPAWLTALETQLAETGVAVAAARLAFVQALDRHCAKLIADPFPAARPELEGETESRLLEAPALEVEDRLKAELKAARGRDAEAGGAAVGPHRSDLAVARRSDGMMARQGSTGEQKGLLIALILAHAQLLAEERRSPPILLLDEVAAHLDGARRTALFALLGELGAQCWMTATETSLFEGLRPEALQLHVAAGTIT